MVVHHRAGSQFCAWLGRSHQRAHHVASMGLRRCVGDGEHHRAFREFELDQSPPTQSDNLQSTILFARFGNGIATNNLSKVIAGLMLPGRPIGNMYFAAWSHNVINGAVQLSMDLKLGEYRTTVLIFAALLLLTICSQDPSPRNVPDADIRHGPGWFHQLRGHDLNRDR